MNIKISFITNFLKEAGNKITVVASLIRGCDGFLVKKMNNE